MITANDLIVTEYSALRDEIISNSQIIAQVFTVALTATAAVIGYGLQAERKNWVLFLIPFAMLIPSLWFISSQLESTMRIGSYIKICMEPQASGLKWETKLAQLRRRSEMREQIYGMPERVYTTSVTGVYGGIGVLCLYLLGFTCGLDNKKAAGRVSVEYDRYIDRGGPCDMGHKPFPQPKFVSRLLQGLGGLMQLMDLEWVQSSGRWE